MWFKKLFKKHIVERNAQAQNAPSGSKSASAPRTAAAKAPDMHELLIGQIRHGCLRIPDDTCELRDRILDGCDKLVSVTVPGTVKRIGVRAFAQCVNLREVMLLEGVETLGTNVFTQCGQLKSVRLPASVREINGWTFYKSGLTEPVFSADGRVLVYYPQTSEAAEYTVPEGVEEIGSRAFIEIDALTRIHLPQSLKRIRKMAFIECGFTEIMIPAGVEIEDGAFRFKKSLKIHRDEARTPLEERLDDLRCQGVSFLYGTMCSLPEDKHWLNEDFIELARRCAEGDVSAMEEMGDYFSFRAEREVFYKCAEQFWRVRACLHGSEPARQYLENWVIENPDARMASPYINENLSGSACGENLNALGFLFFKEGEEYRLSGVDEDGIVEVSSYESEDGPDEDGFGREIYYDWWYLDNCLKLPEGAGYIHNYSHNEKRCNEKKFSELHDRVAAVKRGKK